MKEGERRSWRRATCNIHDGMEERLGKRGLNQASGRRATLWRRRPRPGFEEYLAPVLNEYGDFELTAVERDAVRRAFNPKATQRKIRRLQKPGRAQAGSTRGRGRQGSSRRR